MSHRLSYSESASSSPDLEFSPFRRNVFYIPIPPSGEIVFQSLTREQKRLLRNMGKPSPKKIFDESPPPTPDRRTFRRHSLALSPVLPVSEESDNPAYEVSPKVRESTERVRVYKERLVAMRASRSLGSAGASISPVIESDVSTENVVEVSHSDSAGVEYFEANESDDAHIRLCEAVQIPVLVGADGTKDGVWEPLLAGADEESGLGLEGLGISVWTETNRKTGKLFQDAYSEDNFTVGSATEREELASGEVVTISADEIKHSTILDIHQSQSCHNLLGVDPPPDFRVCEAVAMPVIVKTSEGGDGAWEPIFAGSDKGNGLGLEGLGISVWIGNTSSLEKFTRDSCCKDALAVGIAVEESDVWEDIILSDDEGKSSSLLDTY
jgi:hypothetical protein